MALKHQTINPLSAVGLRRLPFIPEHFAKITISDPLLNTKMLDHWINYHLNSRYAIKKTWILDSNKKVIVATEIGLEDPSELTMFSLGCPLLYNK